jgi:IclR family acetate operon transcriptional repressor
MSGRGPSYPINSVARALELLKMLRHNQRLRVTEVSRELKLAPSTAHRLLAMFEQADLLSHHERNSFYTIGPALVDLATAIAEHLDIEAVVHPHLEDLVSVVNETAHLCVLRGPDVVFLDCVESTHGLRAVSRKGRSIPAYATASGKALLSELSALQLRRLYPEEDLSRLTRKTIQSRSALVNELRRCRDRGYAINAEESELDFSACAGVIRDRAGTARGSIVVAGPSTRFKRYPTGKIGEAVRAACAAAGAALIRRWS